MNKSQVSKIIDQVKKFVFNVKDGIELPEKENLYNKIIKEIVEEFKKNKEPIGNHITFNSIFHIEVPSELDKKLLTLWPLITVTAINKIYDDLKEENKRLELYPQYQYMCFVRQQSDKEDVKVSSFSFEDTPKETSNKNKVGLTITEKGKTKSFVNLADLIEYSTKDAEFTKTQGIFKFNPELTHEELLTNIDDKLESSTLTPQQFNSKLATFSYTDKQQNKQFINMMFDLITVGSLDKKDRRFLTVDLNNVEDVHFNFRYNTTTGKFEIACKELVWFNGSYLPLDDKKDLWFAFDDKEVTLEFGNKMRFPLIINMYKPN
jgi:hypothetical protein